MGNPEHLRLGLVKMIDQMHADGEDALALIHAEKFIRQHRKVQEAVARRCDEKFAHAIVIVHNSGQESTARRQANDPERSESRWALSIMPSKSVSDQLRVFLDVNLKKDQWKTDEDKHASVRFNFQRSM